MSNLGGLPTITNGTCPGRQPDITLVIGPQIFHEYSYELRIWSDYFDTAFRYDQKKTYFEFPHRDPEEWILIKQLTNYWTREPITKENVSIALSWFHELCFPEGIKECDAVISEQVIPMFRVKKGKVWGLALMLQVATDNNLPKTIQTCKDRLLSIYSKYKDVRLLDGSVIMHRLTKECYGDETDLLEAELETLKKHGITANKIDHLKRKIFRRTTSSAANNSNTYSFCVESHWFLVQRPHTQEWDLYNDHSPPPLLTTSDEDKNVLTFSPRYVILDTFLQGNKRTSEMMKYTTPDGVTLITLDDYNPLLEGMADEMCKDQQIKTMRVFFKGGCQVQVRTQQRQRRSRVSQGRHQSDEGASSELMSSLFLNDGSGKDQEEILLLEEQQTTTRNKEETTSSSGDDESSDTETIISV